MPQMHTLGIKCARQTTAGSYNQERSTPAIDPIAVWYAYFATRAITYPRDAVPSAIKECAEKHSKHKIAVGSVSHKPITALSAEDRTAHFAARNTISACV
ncbi:hypothetical protein Y032_0002g560 [Ancylostoma ceylanicum]|uniref:Uncharacterized protein n=1 Tax=Ancylostoma ceylanicum TaxID=53326 RepID=A0A016W186_9BILA|nr:hypothetical protein Y032_0002g560 [Ancylostoma ceylanicum]